MKLVNYHPRAGRRGKSRSSSKNSPPYKRRAVKPVHSSPKPAKRFAKEGAGGLPACASRKYKYYSGVGHNSPTPARSRNYNHIPRGHGGVYNSVYVTHVKARDFNKRDDHLKRIGPDPKFDCPGDSQRSKKSPQPLYKINPNVPHSSLSSFHRQQRSHHKPEKKKRNVRRTHSEPDIRVLYRRDADQEEGYWVGLRRSASEADMVNSTPILRKKQTAFESNDDYLDCTAADNLRNNRIRFDNFFSRVTFIMEDPYTTILCVEETLPLEFSEESEESTSSEVTSYSASQEMAKSFEDSFLPHPSLHDDFDSTNACSCVIS